MRRPDSNPPVPCRSCPARARALLLPYALLGCTDEQETTFEAHMLGCTTCFEDLKALDRAAELIHSLDGTEPALQGFPSRALRRSGPFPSARRAGTPGPRKSKRRG